MNIDKASKKYQKMPADYAVKPKVAIVVLNWNGGEDTINCLESVRKLEYPNFLTVVIDNGSQDGSIEKIKSWIYTCFKRPFMFVEYEQKVALQGGNRESERNLHAAPSSKRIVLIRNKTNLGYDGGNNVAIHYALKNPYPADYVFLLNNDAEAHKDCLDNLVQVSKDKAKSIVGAVVINKKSQEPEFVKSGSFFKHFFVTLTTDQDKNEAHGLYWTSSIVSGAAALIENDVLSTIYSLRGQYLNAGLFAYHDELDFCFFASKIGYKAVVAGAAIVYHRNRERPSSQYRSCLFHYYFTRNAILLASSLLPLHLKILFHIFYFPLTMRRALKMIIFQKRIEARTILAGLFDGYRGIKGKWKLHDSKV